MALATQEPPTRSTDGLAVIAHGVHRSFDGREVLRGLDLSIASDEFVALLGRSGTGKSTLLRILGGSTPTTTATCWCPSAGRWSSRSRV